VKETDKQIFSEALEMANELIVSGLRKFDEFTIGMVDEMGESVIPFLKATYVFLYYNQSMEEISKEMDTIAYIDTLDIEDILEKKRISDESFQLNSEDYQAIEISRRIIKRILVRPNLTPRQIIGIGNFLFALDRLPLKTEGANTYIKIEHKDGDELFWEAKYFSFTIEENIFHIEVSGYVYDRSVGGDSISYPSWYVESEGGRDCDCDLDILEDDILEYMSLGVRISVEDASEIEYDSFEEEE
jgi:hypothetical protein